MSTNRPRCEDCNQFMDEIGGINKEIQIMEEVTSSGTKPDGTINLYSGFRPIGIRDTILYQCRKCKTIKLD